MDWQQFKYAAGLEYGFLTNDTALTPPGGLLEGKMGSKLTIPITPTSEGLLQSLSIIGVGSLDIPFSPFTFSTKAQSGISFSYTFNNFALGRHYTQTTANPNLGTYDDVAKVYSWDWMPAEPIPQTELSFVISLNEPTLDTATVSYWGYEVFTINKVRDAVRSYYPASMKNDNNRIIVLLEKISMNTGSTLAPSVKQPANINIPGVIF